MGVDNPVYIAESELTSLEAGVDELIRSRAVLEQENASLRQQHARLVAEHAALMEKNRQTQSRVERIIERLTALEAVL